MIMILPWTFLLEGIPVFYFFGDEIIQRMRNIQGGEAP